MSRLYRTALSLWEGVRIAVDALMAYKLRTVLTTLGIVIGVTTVVTIVALVEGLNHAFTREISQLGTATLYVEKFPWIMKGNSFWIYRNRRDITMKEALAIRKYATLVEAVAPTVATTRDVKYRNRRVSGVRLLGTDENYMVTSNAVPEIGRFLTPNDVSHRRAVCVLGWEVAEKLFKNEDPIGKRVKVGGYPVRVIGVLAKKGKMFDFNLDTYVVVPIGLFRKITGIHRRVDQIEVKVKDPALMEDARYELEGILRRVRKVPPGAKNDFAINEQSMLMQTYKNLTTSLWAVAIGVGSISLLVGGIGIMNILLVSVTERTREIGIRKAVGAKNRDILWQFLVESMFIVSLGVLIGIGLAILLAKLIASMTPIPAAITGWIVALGIGFVLTIGLVFGIYPASRAARLNPIESLRYE
ncbi:MAG: FtsX-like permease family protein [Calditrichaeota bacterium]|nr:FtsX-like permease family protein [Calditrichota bacterium]